MREAKLRKREDRYVGRTWWRRGRLLGWFFLGAIAGAAAMLLLTPKTGTETRELLTEHSQEWLKKAQAAAEEAQEKAGDLFGKGREYIEEQRNRWSGPSRPAARP